jgi:outer membrane protein OmpA-like peptidoglycan-associated protein
MRAAPKLATPARRRHPAEVAGIPGAPEAASETHPMHAWQHLIGNAQVARMLAQSGRFDRPAARENANRAEAPVQRKLEHVFASGKVAYFPSAVLLVENAEVDSAVFADAQIQGAFSKTEVPLGAHGLVRMSIPVTWDFTSPKALGNEKGNGQLTVEAAFRTPTDPKGDDDKIKWQQPHIVEQGSAGLGASLDQQPQLAADASDKGGSLTVGPRITRQRQLADVKGSTSGVSVGGTVLGVGGNIYHENSEQSQEQVSQTDEFGSSFTAALNVKQPQTVDKHEKTFTHDVRFDVDSDKVREDEEEPELVPWCANDDATVTTTPRNDEVLPSSVQDAVKSGAATVVLRGKASVTGPKGRKGSYNRTLSRRRADNVQKILSDLVGSSAKFQTFALGKYGKDKKNKKTEDPLDRKVEIEVKSEVLGKAPTPAPAGSAE